MGNARRWLTGSPPASGAGARPSRVSGGPGRTAAARPAYYAARPGGWRDWWTLLHPPYTAWHLSYVVIGAALAPQVKPHRRCWPP